MFFKFFIKDNTILTINYPKIMRVLRVKTLNRNSSSIHFYLLHLIFDKHLLEKYFQHLQPLNIGSNIVSPTQLGVT